MVKVGPQELLFEKRFKDEHEDQANIRNARGIISMVESDRRITLYQSLWSQGDSP